MDRRRDGAARHRDGRRRRGGGRRAGADRRRGHPGGRGAAHRRLRPRRPRPGRALLARPRPPLRRPRHPPPGRTRPPPGQPGHHAGAGRRPLHARPRLRERLRDVRVPVLVLWGESDRVATPGYGAAYARAFPAARFAVVPGAGHLPHLEQPEAVLAHLDAELDGPPRTG
ncbi:alpha/beta fold hydrolase [Kitasatospora fiedleri]|uniref:alpha/beta fold hydrolase n=1 Tax=Kitasatospora fiedleri TaxID=2991545 RepID=UPI00384B51F0